ncbi:3-oxoadipate enol-lactonase [soil metagenome]
MERLQVNGISVHVDEMGSRDAPALLMSNSLAADMTMWAAQARVLARDYRVIRFDARGHGRTEATKGDYSLDLLADDILALLDKLEIDRVHFVGLSLGGMIGLLLAVRAPHRLASLVLCATSDSSVPGIWDERVKSVRAAGVGPMVEATLERWLTPGFRAARPGVANAVREMIARTSADGYAGCAAAIRDMNLKGVAERISAPTLLVAAADDPSATPETMSQLHKRIAGAHFALVENAAHLFTMEQPDRSTRILAGFLDGIGDGLERRNGGAQRAAR